MRSNIFFKLVILLCIVSCTKPEPSITPFILPTPSFDGVSNEDFVFDKNVSLHTDFELRSAANFANDFFEEKLGYKLPYDSKPNGNLLQFIFDESIENEEGYELKVDISLITIKAKTAKGAFYAFQSLRQFFPATVENKTFPHKTILLKCALIKDAPRFVYRGMHLDVSRHFFSVEFIKKYIDMMAMLKMNTFHWHLTDDQGWRIEIKQYPELQKVAAYRDETLIGHYNEEPQQFDGKKYGGFYTQEEVAAIVKYATERFVTVIPEIEMPGHSQAAIAAYPNLGCTGKPTKVATKWGVFEDIYCPTAETFTFLENVLDEVMPLFPGKYIHIGGDEAPKTRWKACEHCQALIKKEKLKDEYGLQSYFIARIEKYINSKGKQIIGWDEILEGGLAPNATVMSWRGTEGAVEAAKAGHNVILTPTSHAYFDYYQSDNDAEPLAIGGYLPLEKVYNFNPIPKELNEEEAKHVLGAQGNLWTEYISTSEQAEYMVFPRIIAMAEVVWSNPTKRDYQQKDYQHFTYRLSLFHKRLDAQNVNYANHLYEIEGEITKQNEQLVFDLQTTIKDKTIRYTTDESSPTITSEVYNGTLPIEGSTVLKAAVFNEKEKLGRDFTLTFNNHKAVGATITLDPTPSKAYPGSGKEGLINGVSGSSKRYGDKEWLGFSGKDVTIKIDLGKPTTISSISTRFYNASGQWIHAPEEIGFSFINDEDGRTLNRIALISKSDATLIPYTLQIEELTTQYIEIFIPNYGVIPDGLQGAGHKAWTFLDEIVVK
ncbi:family 20 glycosylhydrolase [Kordia sp. YSTF-M3]|uniref:beta-N-acetylhexosaminidase n=1 Tax=Kordia aestuariivivens TaxID=2759037 RepID=A0ABR7QCA1_9FLAO|nr:family 20 glycosylhydrolase [Kordia aestuariivivens]MBC8756153.1 family 20 glycosylhydrolase [Kordia aestuariivivens]